MKKKLCKILWTILLMIFISHTLVPSGYSITKEFLNINIEEDSFENNIQNEEQENEIQIITEDQYSTENILEEDIEEQEEETDIILEEQENTEDDVEEIIEYEENEEQEEEIQIIGEDVSKRERNIKHFLTNKGTYQALVYPSSVHYEVDGEWKDIDNTLISTKNENGEQVTRNKKNSFKVEFTNNIKEDNLGKRDVLIEQDERFIQAEKVDKRKSINDSRLICLENDKFSMKWSMEGTNKTELKKLDRAEIELDLNKETNVDIEENEEISRGETELENVSSSVIYLDIMDNIDLEYDVTSDYVKETIVLKSENAVRESYIFNMDMGYATLELNKDNSINILDNTGEKVALIEIPYMFDSKMQYSTNIKVILEKEDSSESNIYRMEIIPSLEWLQDEERVYPVKIDPTVTTSLDAQYIEDTTIYSDNIYATSGPNDIVLKVGKGTEGVCRSLIRFTLPTLKAGDQVIGAGLSLYGWFDTWPWWNPPPPHGQMNVHKITSSWSRSTACWANSSEIYDSSKISDFNLYEYSDQYWWAENIWNITDIAKDWYTTANYGLMIKANDESSSVQHDPAFYVSSKVGTDLIDARPMAIIEYRNQAGLESYLNYQEQDLGRAGTGYVNNYNGNLTLIHPDVSTPGSRMPASINHVYNTNDIKKDLGFGTGWKLNITQMITIEIIRIGDQNVEYAKYLDEDGTIHYLRKHEFSDVYYDEDGLGLTLTQANYGIHFIMKDKAGNKMTFEKHDMPWLEVWHLKEIEDVNGNKITISLTYTNLELFYPTSITDGTGTVITINWGGNGRISSIVDQSGKSILYTYDSNNRLTKITYPDLKETNYTYDSRGLLVSAKNIDNSHVDYTYYQASPYRLNTIKEYSTNNEIGNSLEMKYGNNYASALDNKGHKTIYSFNNWGNLIGTSNYGDNPNDLSKAYGQSYSFGIDGEGAKNKLTFESKVIESDINRVVNPSFERNSNWTEGYWHLNSGAISYDTNNKYFRKLFNESCSYK